MGAGIGAAVGAPLGVGAFGSAMTGATIGGFADLTLGVFGRRGIEAASLGKGMQGIAKRNFGDISSSAGRRMGSLMQDAVYSYEGRANDMDLEQIQSNVLAFDNAGGFSNVTSADEMEQVLEGVVENTRQFANKFKMKQEEAVQVMAQLQSSMVATTENMGEFSSKMGHLGEVTGLGAAGITNFGMQGVNMLRGTGVSAAQRFDMALEARTQTERLRYSDPDTRQLIQDAGGADAFSLRTMESSQRYLQSGQGQLGMMNLIQGGSLGASIPDMLGNAAGFMAGGPSSFLEFQNNAGKIAAQLGPMGADSMSLARAISHLKMNGYDVNEDTVISAMANQQGISQEESRAIFARTGDHLSHNPFEAQMQDMFRSRQDFIDENRTSGLDRIGASIGSFFGDITTSSWMGKKAVNIMDNISTGMAKVGAEWRGDRILGGVSLSDNVRKRFNQMEESGEFDKIGSSEDLTASELRAARLKDGGRNIQELQKVVPLFRNHLNDLSEEEMAMIAAGSVSTDETFMRLRNVSKMGIGGVFGDLVNLSGDISEDLRSNVEGVKQTHINSAKTMMDELNIISRGAFGVSFAESTTAQMNATWGRHGQIGDSDKGDRSIIENISSSDAFTQARSIADKFGAAADKSLAGYRESLEDAIADTNAIYTNRDEGDPYKERFTQEERSRIEGAIERGEFSEFDMSGFKNRDQEYLKMLAPNLTARDVTSKWERAQSLYGREKIQRRGMNEAIAGGFESADGIKVLVNGLTERLSRGDLSADYVYDLTNESGATDYIREQLKASGWSDDKITKRMQELKDPTNSYADFVASVHDLRSEIGGSDFLPGLASQIENPVMKKFLWDANGGEDTMSKLNNVITPDGIKVLVENGSSMWYTSDNKDT